MKRKRATGEAKKNSSSTSISSRKKANTAQQLGCGGSNDEVSPDDNVIWFYDENRPWGEFSNFYGKKQDKRFKLRIDGQEWQTTEHYFQAQKFLGPDATDASREYAKLVASQSTPTKAAVLARQKTGGGYKWRTDLNGPIKEYLDKGVELRQDWDEVCDGIMETAVYAKFSQNPFLKEKLLSTAAKKQSKGKNEETKDKGKGKEKEKENEEEEQESEEKASKGKILVEHTSRDCYWADGGDGTGTNMLGQILMKVRDKLISEAK